MDTSAQTHTDEQVEQLHSALLDDIHTMVNFALESGIPIPKELRAEITTLLEPTVNSNRRRDNE